MIWRNSKEDFLILLFFLHQKTIRQFTLLLEQHNFYFFFFNRVWILGIFPVIWQNAACSENYHTCFLKEWLLLPNNQTTFLCNYCVAQGKNICQILTISKKKEKKKLSLLSISVVLKLHNLFPISKVPELDDPFFKITGWLSEVFQRSS